MPGWSTLKKLIWQYRANGGGGAGGTSKTITGVSPLVLALALSKSLTSLTQTGVCEQASTPTPTSPVEIKCNNGAIRMVDDQLPAAYKRVLGFACNNNAMWEIDGFHLRGSDTVKISFSISAITLRNLQTREKLSLTLICRQLQITSLKSIMKIESS